MKATVVNLQNSGLLDDLGLRVGDELEIVGFVERNYQTWAIYLDDEGYLREVPTWALRGAPKAVPA